MQIEKILVREDSEAVFLETYLLKNSAEFQTGARRPAVIVCPGGAYLFTSDREAEPVALRFLAQGYHVFVLRYSVNARFPQPMLDLAKTIQLVRARAEEWLVNPNQITVCGFSAGGHLAASLGVFWQERWLFEPLGVSPEAIQPDNLILGYPVIDLDLTSSEPFTANPQSPPRDLRELMLSTVLGSEPDKALQDRYRLNLHVSATTPPTFWWHTADDSLILVQNSLRFAAALAEHRVPFELHIFESGVHGLSLADETTAALPDQLNPAVQSWLELTLLWLKRQNQKRRN